MKFEKRYTRDNRGRFNGMSTRLIVGDKEIPLPAVILSFIIIVSVVIYITVRL